MNRPTTALAALLLLSVGRAEASSAYTSMPWPEQSFTNASVERTPTSLVLTMDVNPGAFSLKPNRQVWLRPAVVAGADTLWFNPVVVAGSKRYILNERTSALPDNAIQLHAGSEEKFPYQAIVPYQPWMDSCELVLTGTVSGCCGDGLGRMKPDQPLVSCDFRVREIMTELLYVQPVAEEIKARDERGEAYIDFEVNSDRILPAYRRNPEELAKIRATIDEVRGNRDVTLTSIEIKGYASPEGPYAVNERLAKGRTEALAEYVRNLYAFPKSTLRTSWVAEDWKGLAERLKTIEIDNREAIMAIVNDTELGDDAREAQIKTKFPAQYEYLLRNVFPALRHSDYTVRYIVRNYTELAEVAEVIHTKPQLLSLNEMYLYANSLDKSSPEFREVMEVAVRMYPTDSVANLNAATTAIDCGEYEKARAYLKKAGDTPESTYAAGVLALKEERWAEAATLLRKASGAGVREAGEVLGRLEKSGFLKD